MTGIDASQLLGPLGGQLALAFGAGCAAGYAFCIRTVYKLLNSHHDIQHQACLAAIDRLRSDNEELKQRVIVLEDRLYHGTSRQLDQIRDSSIRVLGEHKLGKPDVP